MSVSDTSTEDQRIDVAAMFGAVLARWLRIAIVTAVALGVTFVIVLFLPRLYESTAAILVEQRANAAVATPNQQPQTPSIPVEAMMSSQIELIRSRDTLLAVIDTVGLRSEPEFSGAGASPVTLLMQLFGRKPEQHSIDETVLQNLNARLTVAQQRTSAVISINVSSTNPELAARIANAIAAAHVARRTDLSLSDTAEASQWLEQEIARLRIKVQEAEAAVADYRVDNDLFTGTDNTSILDQQLTAVSTQITEAQQRKNAAQSRANLIRELLASGRPLDGVQDVRDSVVIQQLSQTKANLQGELAQRSSTLLDGHPTIKALRAQIAEIEDQITGEARRVADALEAEAEIEGNLETSLRDDLTRMKLSVSNATKDTVTLDSLEREAKAQRDLLESYLLRYSDATSRTGAGSALPDVRQITIAAPAVEPASPKTALILGAVGFVALALQIGGILFGELMSGRALTDRTTFRQYRATEPADDEIDEAMDGEIGEEAIDAEPDAVADLFDLPEAANDAEPPEPLPELDLDLDSVIDVAPEPEPAAISAETIEPAKPVVAAPAEKPAARTVVDEPAIAADEPAKAFRAAAQRMPEEPAAPTEDPAIAFAAALASAKTAQAAVAATRPEVTAPAAPADVRRTTVVPQAEPQSAPAERAAVSPPPALEQQVASAALAREARPARPEPQSEVRPDPAVGQNALELSNLSADIAIGRVRVVMLAGLTDNRASEEVADTLIADALRRGLSIVRIDAGSGRPSMEPGITDLAAELVSFGDVVHRVRDGLAEVPWGQHPALERRSTRPVTLIEALTDIYEVVIIMTGRIGMNSTLPVFAGVPCRLVLVGNARPDRSTVEAAVEDATNLGFEVGQIVHPLSARYEVA